MDLETARIETEFQVFWIQLCFAAPFCLSSKSEFINLAPSDAILIFSSFLLNIQNISNGIIVIHFVRLFANFINE